MLSISKWLSNDGWFLFYCRLMELREMRTLAQFQGSEMSQRLNLLVCVSCKSRELGGRVSPRLPCVTPVMGSFFSDLLETIISYWTDLHLEPCQTSTVELISENSLWPNGVNYFRKKTPP